MTISFKYRFVSIISSGEEAARERNARLNVSLPADPTDEKANGEATMALATQQLTATEQAQSPWPRPKKNCILSIEPQKGEARMRYEKKREEKKIERRM